MDISLNSRVNEKVKSFIDNISPNPWISNTTVSYYLNQEGLVKFDFIDVSGRVIYSDLMQQV